MARTFLRAFKAVRDIRLCKVYSPTVANREAFAEEMSKALNIEVRADRRSARGGARRGPAVVVHRQHGTGL